MRVDVESELIPDDFIEDLDSSGIFTDLVDAVEEETLALYHDIGDKLFYKHPMGAPEWTVERKKHSKYSVELRFKTDHFIWKVLDFGRAPHISAEKWMGRADIVPWGEKFHPTVSQASRPNSMAVGSSKRADYTVIMRPGVAYGTLEARNYSRMIGEQIKNKFLNDGVTISVDTPPKKA